jgi:hypothetical protein
MRTHEITHLVIPLTSKPRVKPNRHDNCLQRHVTSYCLTFPGTPSSQVYSLPPLSDVLIPQVYKASFQEGAQHTVWKDWHLLLKLGWPYHDFHLVGCRPCKVREVYGKAIHDRAEVAALPTLQAFHQYQKGQIDDSFIPSLWWKTKPSRELVFPPQAQRCFTWPGTSLVEGLVF